MNKPLRPCKHPGCFVLVSDGYCEKHRPIRKDTRSEQSKAWRWMYNTKIWKDVLRPMQLAKVPWCEECARHGIRRKATDVDHIIDHKGDKELFRNPENLQSLCHECHSAKTLRDVLKQEKPPPGGLKK